MKLNRFFLNNNIITKAHNKATKSLIKNENLKKES